jgi:arylsulfatase A-like enzyme
MEESRMVSALDLAPTVLAAAEAEIPNGLDGIDLTPHLVKRGTDAIRNNHYWRMGGQAAFRAGEWKIFRGNEREEWSLFNLSNDPSEDNDLSAEHPEKLKELASSWREIDREMMLPLWNRNGVPAKDNEK